MITVILVAVAVYALSGKWIADRAKEILAQHTLPKIETRHVAALALLLAALVSWASRPGEIQPPPAPLPPPAPVSFTLVGKFVGPTAADDAAMLSALCGELASCIEWDGDHDQRLKTGVMLDDLRVAAREARMRGDSIGARQPHVRDSVQRYLDEAVGSSGGPVTTDQRAAWVSAMRDISRAAADVSR